MALVDPAKVPDPRAALEAVLGPLAMFETLPDAQPAPEIAPALVSEAQRQPYQPDRAPVVDLELLGGGPSSSSSAPEAGLATKIGRTHNTEQFL